MKVSCDCGLTIRWGFARAFFDCGQGEPTERRPVGAVMFQEFVE